MVSTLFLLILSGIMTQSIMKISANHIIQLQQISKYYQEETALNLAESLLEKELMKEEGPLVKKASFLSSAGEIKALKKSTSEYELILTRPDSQKRRKKIHFHFLKEEELGREKIKK